MKHRLYKKLADGGKTGAVKDTSGHTLDILAVQSQVQQMASSGKLSNRDANRILKGLKTVESSVTNGITFTYSLNGNNTFTAQKDGVDIEGKASGLNVNGNILDRTLTGRKVSKAIGFIQSQNQHPSQNQNQAVENQTPANSSTSQFVAEKPLAVNEFSFGVKRENPFDTSKMVDKSASSISFTPFSSGNQSQAEEKPLQTQPTASTSLGKKPVAELTTPKKTTTDTGKKSGISLVAPKNTITPAVKISQPMTKKSVVSKPVVSRTLPKTVKEAIPVVDLYTVEDAARDEAAKKAVIKKPVLQQKPVANQQPVQNQEPDFFESIYSNMSQAIKRQGTNAQIDKDRLAQERKIERNKYLKKEITSDLMQNRLGAILDFFKKNPNQKSYRFFTWEGLGGRNYYTVTPDGRIVSDEDSSVMANYRAVQKKEDGGLTYTLGSTPIIDPKKRFIPAINPIGIHTSYQMPQQTISFQSPSIQPGKPQKTILPNFQIPFSYQTTIGSEEKKNKPVDWLRMANAGLGVAGAISYAAAKRPVLPGPIKFESTINPATGLTEASKRFAQNQIAQQTAQANQMANTSDNRYNTAVKLQANYNANQALANLAVQDSQVYEQNLQRVNEQQNRDAYINFQNQQNYNQQKFEQDNQYYQQHRDMGTQMAQNALTYEVQRKADMENKRVLENQTNQQLAAMAEQEIIKANNARILQGKPVLTEQETDAIRTNFMQHATSNYQKPLARLAR